jgi:hypothetical protein
MECRKAARGVPRARNLLVELGEDGRYFGHDLLGVLHSAGGGLERRHDLLLELLLGLALKDHLLERADKLRDTMIVSHSCSQK